ncbi:MAG: gamma-glutamyltransferase [Acidimicrobiia bacterium]|nr:gamma-glutamyltransferase [Acidimicrobiia bacterium]
MAWLPPHTGATCDAAIVDPGRGVVVSPHYLAGWAGIQTLRAGGNAVDAAVAANAVLGVVLPDTCGPGGDLFALVHRPGDPRPGALNASGRAGSGADGERLRRSGHTTIPIHGVEGITVPGCVDGWEVLLAGYGSMPLGEVLAPAIAVAAAGFEVSAELARSLGRSAGLIATQPSATALYPDGRPPLPGTMVRRPDLAETLAAVAAGGRTAFYGGAAGEGMVAATGGLITADDLAVVQADWVEPLGLGLYGLEAWTVPPNSRGYLTLAATWMAERLGSAPGSPQRHHHLIEAYQAAAGDAAELVADPATAPRAAADLVDPERLADLLATIGPDAAPRPAPAPATGGTAYLCCRDGSGIGVSLIQSNFHGIGSGLSAGDTGVFLHNRGAGFNLVPGHPNELTPGRRPAHTLSPTLWTDAGGLRLLLGTRGGHYQPQLLVQMIDCLLGAGLAPAEAMRRPRWVVEDGTVQVESRMPAEVVAGLRARGHPVAQVGAWEEGWGPVAVVAESAGTVSAAADPRVSTASVAVA